MTITLKINKDTALKMKEFYNDRITGVPNYTMFQAKDNDCTITVYTSLKAVFQGKNAEQEASIWGTFTNTTKSKKDTTNPTQYNQVFNSSAIGSDEVGTGDYFGPMVVCSSFVSKNDGKKNRPANGPAGASSARFPVYA